MTPRGWPTRRLAFFAMIGDNRPNVLCGKNLLLVFPVAWLVPGLFVSSNFAVQLFCGQMQGIRGGQFRTVVGILTELGFQIVDSLINSLDCFIQRFDLGFERMVFGLKPKGIGLPYLANGTKDNKIVFCPLGKGFEVLFRDVRKIW